MDIFNKGRFNQYNAKNINDAQNVLQESYGNYTDRPTKVFISHKHSDLAELKHLIGFLEEQFNIIAYIDSWDSNMPTKTCADTAVRIKNKIRECDRFILFATDDAIESKWCNWELGYGDAKKFVDKQIAIFPIKDETTERSDYKGSEYMQMYPRIYFSDGTEEYNNGEPINKGYYILYNNSLTSLSKWFKK